MTYTSRNVFLHLARYNRRANAEIFEVLAKLTERARRRDAGSHFGSMWTLLNHIIIAGMYWLNRFKPIYPDSVVLKDPLLSPPELSWDRDLREDFDGLRRQRSFVDERIIAWFDECPEERYGQLSQMLDALGLPSNIADNGAFLESAD